MPPRLTICLHRGTTLLDRLIRWQQRGEWSHASWILSDGRQVEARPGKGVLVHPQFTPRAGETVERFTIEATPEQVASIEAYVLEQVGCGYDWWAVLCFVTRTHPRRASATRWFCSELVAGPAALAGITLFRATQSFEVGPVLLGRSLKLLNP